MSDSPMMKSSKSYHYGLATGVSDGTMAGQAGAEERKREQEKQRKEQESWNSSSSSSSSSSKVICTELHRQGLMSRADYLVGAEYARANLSERHYRGYHVWALAVVRHMRRSKRATAFWRVLTAARADHIAFLHGDTSRRNRLGAVLCAIGHPVCYALGGMVKAQDWQSLYTGGEPRASK